MIAFQRIIRSNCEIIEEWWQTSRREHQLFLRLMREKPSDLEDLHYLDPIISHIERNRVTSTRKSYPYPVHQVREHLLSAEHFFLACLRALQTNDLDEAYQFYNLAQADMSMLQFIFMENGLKPRLK